MLAETVGALAGHDINVIATLGSSLKNPHAGTERPNPRPDDTEVRFVPFVPLGQLLDRADLVVGSGGAGTVLGTLAHGLPMVLWPQGADQPINAARAAAAGTAITVDNAASVSPAVRKMLTDSEFRSRAETVAAENNRRLSPADVIARIAAA
ncbi:glycosyltransferase [Saccharomonospora sp. CUA-673]|uniref:glycosyltransferase n=1 Tax=Saccharomonospora sp. CUA-673 TaxID=1904969 RepID=UPI001C9E5178|nr:nucleotide disphospho-sugar-binding domain-containing protein [Saccharomonospora sp. CUA-673]